MKLCDANRFRAGVALLSLSCAASGNVWAQTAAAPVAEEVLSVARPREALSVAAYGAVWTNSRFLTFPYNAVTGNLTFERAYAAGAIAAMPVKTFSVGVPGLPYRFDGVTLEVETTLLRHFGGQRHSEAAGALVLRSGEFRLPGNLSMNVAFGNGLSYAFEDAALEIGKTGRTGVETYRLQYHMSVETAFSSIAFPNASLFVRLHHRSGVYGVISPRRSGSNLLGGGLRWTFY